MYDFVIYDFNLNEFTPSTKVDKKDLTKRDVDLAVAKQLNNLPHMIQTRKVGDKFYAIRKES